MSVLDTGRLAGVPVWLAVLFLSWTGSTATARLSLPIVERDKRQLTATHIHDNHNHNHKHLTSPPARSAAPEQHALLSRRPRPLLMRPVTLVAGH